MMRTIKRTMVISTFICMILFSFWGQKVFAAVDTADTVQALQTKVDSAMHSRVASYTINYTGNVSTISSDIANVINNIFNADDYLHYSTKTYSALMSGISGNLNITFNFAYWENATQADYVSTQVTQILSQIITTGMNDYQKEKAIHDWIEKNVAYDTTLVQHSAYAALVSPYKTVCQGYALLAYKMLTQSGVQTKILEGVASGQAHSWVEVNLDGAWYHLDPTWDDPIPDVAGRVLYDYYNLTDAQIKVNHTWTKSYPAANTLFSDTLNSKLTSDAAKASIYQGLINDLGLQYLTTDYTVSNSTDLNAKIQQAIRNQQTGIKERYAGSAIAADIKAAFTGISNITSYSYSYSDYVRTTQTGDVLLDLKFTYNIPVSVTAISLNQSTMSLTVGGTAGALTATVSPSNASNKTIIWSTSDSNVATVNGGVVKAVGGGTATIKGTTSDGGYTATATITVTAPVTGITLEKTKMLKVGDLDLTLNPIITPASATNKNVTWSSSNSNVATVDSTGLVHAVSSGIAVITVTTQDGSKKATCTVTVPTLVTGVSFTQSTLTLKVGQTTATIVPIFAPSNATIKTATWTSSDSTIATVSSSGLVTPVADGTAIITATTTDGSYKATCTITVIHGVNSITMEMTKMIKVGDPDVTLSATIAPSNATIKDVTWNSSNASIATVDNNGVVHAVAPGVAIITVTSKQDSTKKAACTFTVQTLVTGVSFTQSTLTLKVGQTTATLVPVIAPSSATIKTVTWESSDSTIATVSTSGLVTPVADGTATITATTTDGSYKATCTITVIHGVNSITMEKTKMIKVGDPDVTLDAIIAPSNATIKDVTWSSSNASIATVDSSGVVHAVAPGVAIITVTSKQDSTKKATCTFTVQTLVTGVSFTQSTLTLKVGQTTAAIVPVIAPSSATIKTVTWESSDSTIATVSTSGLVTPVADGTAIITATTTDGSYKATCTITVIHGVISIALDKKTAMIKVGDSDVTLNATIAPSNATIKDVTWSSSNASIATVDSSGVVHAVAPGVAIITVTSKQDSTKKAACTVTVPTLVTGVKLSLTTLSLKVGQTPVNLVATLLPSNATIKTVTWSSSNTAVATVSATGTVKAISAGTAIVTVTTVDGGFTAVCSVTVN